MMKMIKTGHKRTRSGRIETLSAKTTSNRRSDGESEQDSSPPHDTSFSDSEPSPDHKRQRTITSQATTSTGANTETQDAENKKRYQGEARLIYTVFIMPSSMLVSCGRL